MQSPRLRASPASRRGAELSWPSKRGHDSASCLHQAGGHVGEHGRPVGGRTTQFAVRGNRDASRVSPGPCGPTRDAPTIGKRRSYLTQSQPAPAWVTTKRRGPPPLLRLHRARAAPPSEKRKRPRSRRETITSGLRTSSPALRCSRAASWARPSRGADHAGEHFLDFVQGLAAEVRGPEHLGFGLLDQVADVDDVVVLQAVGRTDRRASSSSTFFSSAG